MPLDKSSILKIVREAVKKAETSCHACGTCNDYFIESNLFLEALDEAIGEMERE